MATGFTRLTGFAGVNMTAPASEIADNELALARNCFAKEPGIVGPRMQQGLIGSVFTSAVTGTPNANITDLTAECGLYHFLDANNAAHLVFWTPYDGQATGVTGNAGSFLLTDDALSGSASKSVFLPSSTPAAASAILIRAAGYPRRPVSLVYNNELFLFLGHTYPGLVLGAEDMQKVTVIGVQLPQFREFGSTWSAFSGAFASPDGSKPQFAFGEIYKDIFALGGLPAPYESLIFFTEGVDSTGAPQPHDYTLLPPAAGIGCGLGDGDKLLRVKATPIVGGAVAVEQYAIAFKQRSVWLLQGDPPTTTDSGTLVVTPIMRREGLIAPHAVCDTPYGTAWCSGRNVWLMPPGTQPRPIGFKIKGLLETLPQTPSELWSLEFHDDVLYLNMPSPRGLITGRDAYAGDGASLTYLASQQMWCDLRNPDMPQWWGPQDVRCAQMLSTVQTEGVHQLIGLTPRKSSTAAVTGFVPFIMTDKGDNKGRDLGDAGTTNTFKGNQVPTSTFQDVKFRDMNFGDENLQKLVDGLEVNATWDVGLGTAKGTLLANDVPLVAQYLGDGGKEAQTPNLPGRAAVTVSANPNAGSALIELEDDISGGGGQYAALLAALALRKTVAWNVSIAVQAGWAGGNITLIGTDMYGAAQTEAVTATGAGGSLTSTKYFLTLTNITLASGAGSGLLAEVTQGPSIQTQDTATDPASVGFTLNQNTLGSSSANPTNLSKTFIPLVYFPANGSRFRCETFQPRLASQLIDDANPPVTAEDIRTRRFWVKSITPRIRPLGRRPGGSYGG